LANIINDDTIVDINYCAACRKYVPDWLLTVPMPFTLTYRAIWLKRLEIMDDDDVLQKHNICERHFDDNDFCLTIDHQLQLKPGTLPLIRSRIVTKEKSLKTMMVSNVGMFIIVQLLIVF
jgi:hypothetical protein